MKTIETKIAKSGNITVKVNGERTSLKIAAAILNRAMVASNNEAAEIVNEAGEKFIYGGSEWKQGYTHYYFNNDNGKSFEIHNVIGYNAVAESAIRTIANMPAIEKMNAEYQASQIRLEEIFAINDYAVSPEAQEIAINAEETAATVETETAAEVKREDNNTDVFDLLPTADELNDVDTDEVTMSKAEAEFAQVEAEMQDMQTALEIEMCEGNDDNALVIADKIVELNARYGHLYEQIYGHTVEVYTDPESVIAATAGLLKHENTAAEVTDTEHFIQVDNKPEVTETERKIAAAELKAKYDASDDEDERVEICIEAYRNCIEPRIKQQTREIAEQVCDSMTAAAPEDWSVAFTENGKFAVYSSDSVNVVDTITAGDFLNPKEFFEQFRRKPTQAELDDPNVAALAELNHEREQLLTVRDELAREYPDEVERLKLLDEMIAETDADITALKTFKKPRDAVEFDDKGNVKAVWF